MIRLTAALFGKPSVNISHLLYWAYYVIFSMTFKLKFYFLMLLLVDFVQK
ncbi:hypothetical protein BCV71DRAFT_193264 [Rhizopus microsporus]|uniref:Uncharacterized protein n=1 Tax=Rhizopus microsporus TaxID=58291 RepID=A0A1X0SD91_RHIZD|nr:hypothetical protein BCV71DRAFT_193264 [Rhizopus microsporus]